jgi:putative ABC transport system permease protein
MMRYKKLMKAAFKSLVKNRMRSLLTSLGIIIGVCAVIVMVAVGQGSQDRIEKQISALGANVIMIFPGASQRGGVNQGAGSYNRLTLDDVKVLREQSTLATAISPIVMSHDQVIGGIGNWYTSVEGVSPEFLTIREWDLASGESFTERDVEVKKKVAIIGKEVADNLFPDMDPIGEKIRIRDIPFEVIGVLAEKGQSAMGSDQDDIVLAPATTVLYRLKGGQYINMIMASAVSPDRIDEAQDELTSILRSAHKLDYGTDDDFRIRNQAEITEAASESSRILTLLLGSIAGVSLLVGGIGIMNIMLVSVTERTREIGIRLAVGAHYSDVLIQFLSEAVVLSLIGGIIGIMVAFGLSYMLSHFAGVATSINPAIVFLAFAFSGTVGIFFGFYPARKAAALDPIEALRHE